MRYDYIALLSYLLSFPPQLVRAPGKKQRDLQHACSKLRRKTMKGAILKVFLKFLVFFFCKIEGVPVHMEGHNTGEN